LRELSALLVLNWPLKTIYLLCSWHNFFQVQDL